jgi:hypothetical protein
LQQQDTKWFAERGGIYPSIIRASLASLHTGVWVDEVMAIITSPAPQNSHTLIYTHM